MQSTKTKRSGKFPANNNRANKSAHKPSLMAKPPSGSRYRTKIQALEAEIGLLTSCSSDTVYRLRYDTMTYDYISPAVLDLLGFTVEEMRRINFRSLILETRMVTDGMRSLQSFSDLEGKRRAGNVNKWQADYLIRRKDGRKIWVADVSYPWFDDHGNVIGSRGSMRDVTERVEAEARAKAELERIANTDGLTGIYNRRHFFDETERELKRINRSKSELSMLIIDIDHFKSVNDTYGHDVGDMVIIEIAHLICAMVREVDVVARIGGEEYGVLLPDTSAEGAIKVACKIHQVILAHSFNAGAHGNLSCSVSIGIATTNAAERTSPADIYKSADTQLYIAKNTGRNQVSFETAHMYKH